MVFLMFVKKVFAFLKCETSGLGFNLSQLFDYMKKHVFPRTVAVKLVIKASVTLATAAAYCSHGTFGAQPIFGFGMLKEAAKSVTGKNVADGGSVYVEAFKFVQTVKIAGVAGAVRFNDKLGVTASACTALLRLSRGEKRKNVVKIPYVHTLASSDRGEPAVKQSLLEACKFLCAETEVGFFTAERVKAIYGLNVSEVVFNIKIKQLRSVGIVGDYRKNIKINAVLSQKCNTVHRLVKRTIALTVVKLLFAVEGNAYKKAVSLKKFAKFVAEQSAVCLQGKGNNGARRFVLVCKSYEAFKKAETRKQRLTALKHERNRRIVRAKLKNSFDEIFCRRDIHYPRARSGAGICFVAIKAITAFEIASGGSRFYQNGHVSHKSTSFVYPKSGDER